MSSRKLLLIGWDAADWDLIQPLLDQGEMPNLLKVIESGVSGKISTLDPPVAPLHWTSIATGKTADEHRILSVLEPDPLTSGARIASSTSRASKAIWNILHQNGLRTHVLNWFASHPAEPIRGVCVSNAASKATADIPAGSIHPPELTSTLASLRLTPEDLRGEDLALFLPKLDSIDWTRDPRPVQLAQIVGEGMTVHSMATWVLEHQEWDFVALYLDMIDRTGQDFMIFHPPKMEHIGDQDFEHYRHVMTSVYKMHDLMLGRLVQLAGPDSTIMIVSDHGFSSGALRHPESALWPKSNPLAWHRQFGIFCLSGPGIRKDDLVQGATLLDVAPTILALFQLPAGDDMKGRVLAEAFEQSPLLDRIPSWESVEGDAGMHVRSPEPAPWDSAAAVDQLAALGYTETLSPELAEHRQKTLDDQKYALARVYLSNQKAAEAIPLLEELLAKTPGSAYLRVSLGQAYLLAGRYEESDKIGRELLDHGAQEGVAHVMRANSAIFQNNPEEALRHLAQAEQTQPPNPNTWCLVADAYVRMDRRGDAEVNYRKALEMDRFLVKAWCGLSSVLLSQKRFTEAASAAMEAVGLEYSLPAAHYLLGVSLLGAGAIERGNQALETFARLAPKPAERGTGLSL